MADRSGALMTDGEKTLILIVDDNPQNIQVLGNLMEGKGYDVAVAMNGGQVLDFIKDEKPDLILMDIMMPGMDGYAVCGMLKQNPETADIPVIFLTAKTEDDDIVLGLKTGAVDYVTKPFSETVLFARIRTHVELKKSRENIRRAKEELEKRNLKLQAAMKDLELAARTDSLTGLYNRRYMQNRLDEELVRVKRNKKDFTVVMSDIDFFKRINDAHGHECGDHVLKFMAGTLRSGIREQDIVSRWGGEEFIILLPETDKKGGLVLSEKIRKAIEASVFRYSDMDLRLTMTFGVATYRPEESIDELLKRADDALYAGKESGRNRVITL